MKDRQKDFPSQLISRLWHTTSLTRYQMIREVGNIMPEPPISDQERWGACSGPECYPYVRSLGGVSLFDSESFNPEHYDKKYPLSTWQEFVPYRSTWGQAIWIEINRESILGGFINAKELLARWKSEGAYKHNIMPMIEAAHLGPIPLAAFSCVLKCGDDADDFEVLS